jgi:hypothetical protein
MAKPPYIRQSDDSVHEGRVVHPGQDWSLQIEATDLTFIRVDHQSRLQFDGTEVVIESAFELRTAGEIHHLDPEVRAGLGPFLSLYPDTLSAGFVEPDCSLHLEFVSGAQIIVRQDARYEAWQISGPGRRLVVCPPVGGNGGLSVWQIRAR